MKVLRATLTIFLVVIMGSLASGAWAAGADAAAEARQRAEFARLNDVRKGRRAQILSLPGVVGLGTETREDPKRAVITIYVHKDTPALRSQIEARFSGVPIEIIEKPGGFRAY